MDTHIERMTAQTCDTVVDPRDEVREAQAKCQARPAGVHGVKKKRTSKASGREGNMPYISADDHARPARNRSSAHPSRCVKHRGRLGASRRQPRPHYLHDVKQVLPAAESLLPTALIAIFDIDNANADSGNRYPLHHLCRSRVVQPHSAVVPRRNDVCLPRVEPHAVDVRMRRPRRIPMTP